MTTGPDDRRLGLGWALEEFEQLLAERTDEVPDDIDDLPTYEKP